MDTIIITLAHPQGRSDLELSATVMLKPLIAALVEALGLPDKDQSGESIEYELYYKTSKTQQKLNEKDTLERQGIIIGNYLVLQPAYKQQAEVQSALAGTVAYSHARLRCSSGRIISLDNLGKNELSIGRYNARTDERPDIELANEPRGNTVSRAHATLKKQYQQWVLIPRTKRSITKINGEEISEERGLLPGDRIALGGVSLQFEADL